MQTIERIRNIHSVIVHAEIAGRAKQRPEILLQLCDPNLKTLNFCKESGTDGSAGRKNDLDLDVSHDAD